MSAVGAEGPGRVKQLPPLGLAPDGVVRERGVQAGVGVEQGGFPSSAGGLLGADGGVPVVLLGGASGRGVVREGAGAGPRTSDFVWERDRWGTRVGPRNQCLCVEERQVGDTGGASQEEGKQAGGQAEGMGQDGNVHPGSKFEPPHLDVFLPVVVGEAPCDRNPLAAQLHVGLDESVLQLGGPLMRQFLSRTHKGEFIGYY